MTCSVKTLENETLFNPDVISARIHQALLRDLSCVRAEHGYNPAAIQLANNVGKDFKKKYLPASVDTSVLDGPAYEKFYAVCDHLEGIELDLPTGFTSCQRRKMSDSQSVLYRARAIINTVLGKLDEDEWFGACRHGTGSTIGVPYVDTSLEAKNTFPISMTSRVQKLYDRYLTFDFVLKDSIDKFNRYRPYGEWYKIVDGSRATTVPKNAKTNRIIAIEPTGNMFFQLGLMACMYERLAAFGLDVRTLPDMHQLLARVASMDGVKSTIDWQSASDCVLYQLVEFLFPHDWFWALDIVRSPSMEIDKVKKTLPMFSTMGNATTFPIETLIFWALAEATKMHESETNTVFLEKGIKTASVFGDDCIVETSLAEAFITSCTRVGFLVNTEKSFFDAGPGFRESCGGDYYRGYDVRAYHLKSPVDNRKSALAPWLYTILNRLTMKYIKCFGPVRYLYNKELFHVISKLFREYGIDVLVVPPFYPEDAGFQDRDFLRFKKHYDFKTSEVAVDIHGTVSFAYQRFVYAGTAERKPDHKDDYLTYADSIRRTRATISRTEMPYATFYLASSKSLHRYVKWVNSNALQSGSLPIDKWGLPKFRKKKLHGGYVVAKALTCHWQPR
jgi:hypothetical protein